MVLATLVAPASLQQPHGSIAQTVLVADAPQHHSIDPIGWGLHTMEDQTGTLITALAVGGATRSEVASDLCLGSIVNLTDHCLTRL